MSRNQYQVFSIARFVLLALLLWWAGTCTDRSSLSTPAKEVIGLIAVAVVIMIANSWLVRYDTYSAERGRAEHKPDE
jgi:hypothetical protein